MEFGAGAALNTEALDWRTFKKSFLPGQVLGMTIVNGLIKETDDGSWIVDPDKLVFEVESAIPNKLFKIETVTKYTESPAIGAGPMLTSDLDTEINIDLDELTVNPLDATNDHFTVERIEKSIPAAVWGVSGSTKPAVNPSKRLIPNVLSGMRFTVIPPTPPDTIANISSENLAFNEADHGTIDTWETLDSFLDGEAPDSVQNDLIQAYASLEAMPGTVGQLAEADLATLDLTVSTVKTGAY